MNAKLIIVDGKTYHSVEEMPPEIRQKYELAMRALGDANGNQIPDVLEGMNILADQNKNGKPDLLENLTTSNVVVKSTKIILDGKEFSSIEHLPPEARARYEQAMGKLDANRNGIPDFIEGMVNTTDQTANAPTSLGTAAPPRSTPLPIGPTTTSEVSNGWRLALAGLFVALLCLVGTAGVWYLFLR